MGEWGNYLLAGKDEPGVVAGKFGIFPQFMQDHFLCHNKEVISHHFLCHESDGWVAHRPGAHGHIHVATAFEMKRSCRPRKR